MKPLLTGIAACLALIGQSCAAAHLELTSPPGGGDPLVCSALQGGKLKKTRHGEDIADFRQWVRFGTDQQSERTEEYSDGYIDIGLNGEYLRLKSAAGASLALGGAFANDADPRTGLRITPLKVNYIANAHAKGESVIGIRARFELRHGNERRAFVGQVRCSVYDFESYYGNVCTGTKEKASLACRALWRSIGESGKN